MDLRQLRYFVAIAERGSFSAAASALNIAQSALSRHVQSLEQELGGPLLERGARGVTLSESGRVLLERARFILGEVANAGAEIAARNDELSGTVRFGAPPSLASVLFVPLALRFARDHPLVNLRLTEGLTEKLCADVLAGSADAAIVTAPSRSDHLDFTPLFRERTYLIGQPDDPLFRRQRISMKEVSGLKFVLSVEFLRRRYQQLSGRYQVETVGSLKRLVAAGLGYGLLPSTGLNDDFTQTAFGSLEVPEASGLRVLAMPKSRPVGRAARAFVAALHEEVQGLIRSGKIKTA